MFRIDPKNPVSIGEQIYRQIAFAIAAGAFPPGEKLPSVRELASLLLVNPNTVAKAFRDLERDGLVDSKRGLGVFVGNGSPARCERIRLDVVRRSFRDCAAQAGQGGLDAGRTMSIAAEEIESEFRKRRK